MSFLSNQNIELLWEVLLGESSIQQIQNGDATNLYNMFIHNVHEFYQNEQKNNNNITELVSLNKKCLTQIIRSIKTPSNNSNTTNNTHNIYKIQDIHAKRQQLFEEQLAQKRNDFELSMTMQKPPVPNFTEKIENDKIQGMDELIARTIAQRNFDVSQINALSSQTSQNVTKTNKIKIKEEISNNIIKSDVVELGTKNINTKLKSISWDDEKNQTQYFDHEDMIEDDQHDEEQDINIFNKLNPYNRKNID